MGNLSEQINIGKTLAEKLNQVGIHTIEELKAIGTENAFLKLETVDCTACINMLYALEGAVQGIRWHGISAERKNELKDFFKRLKN